MLLKEIVAPLAGAWIEIRSDSSAKRMTTVAPLAGAWIEICSTPGLKKKGRSRSPRGSVD